METAYLALNAIIYVLLGLWCAWDPHFTSEAVGVRFEGIKGIAEYYAVYGGLQFGMGIFFGLACLEPTFQKAAVSFAACVYGGLVFFRLLSVALNGSALSNGWYFFALEASFLVFAVLLLRSSKTL